jgi:hypothetical protein
LPTHLSYHLPLPFPAAAAVGARWTRVEDDLLTEAVGAEGENWGAIMGSYFGVRGGGRMPVARGRQVRGTDAHVQLRAPCHEHRAPRPRALQDSRTEAQLEHRWKHVLQAGLVKGPWTPTEDDALLDCVVARGMTDWVEIAKHVPGRTRECCGGACAGRRGRA